MDAVELSALRGVDDSAHCLGNMSPWTLRKHIAEGNIKVVRIGKRVFLAEHEIRRIQREGLPSLRASSKPKV